MKVTFNGLETESCFIYSINCCFIKYLYKTKTSVTVKRVLINNYSTNALPWEGWCIKKS